MAATNDMFSYSVDCVDPYPLITTPNYNPISLSSYVSTATNHTSGFYTPQGSPAGTIQPWGYADQYNYYPPPQQSTPYPYQQSDLLKALAGLGKSQQQKENPLNIRGLFEVFAVRIKDDDVCSAIVAAKDDSSARLKAFRELGLNDPDDYTFLIRRIGDLPARKETQKVRIVTTDIE